MIPDAQIKGLVEKDTPRMSGDDPIEQYQGKPALIYSPHERG